MLPGNPRYQPQSVVPYFGYDNLYRSVAEVEIAALKTLGEFGVIPRQELDELTPEVEQLLLSITTSEVDEVERRVTKHNIRAWVQIARDRLGSRRITRWLHIPLTSFDPLDTGRILGFIRAHDAVVAVHTRNVARHIATFALTFAEDVQIGRTHGQHALPITVGFWLATILHRIVGCGRHLEARRQELVGKISGAVGAHNAQIAMGLTPKDGGSPSFECRVLAHLGLDATPISTQILPPEPRARYLFECCLLSAALGQLGRDCRHLMRSEIAEVAESYEAGQVGSSTMAQKRNPISFENLEGTWLKTKNEFGKVLDTLISEHQRELVGSAPAHDFPTIVVNLVHQLETILRADENGTPFLNRITIDRTALQRNVQQSANMALAEPLYIALQMAGYASDAHELINRRIVPLARAKKPYTLLDAAEELAEDDEGLATAIRAIPEALLALFRQPETYVGDAADLARRVAEDALDYARSPK